MSSAVEIYADLNLSCKTKLLEYKVEDVVDILKKYGKNLQVLQESVKYIKRWVEEEECLSLIPCDRKIVSLLILNEFSLERTKRAIDKSHVLKSFMPEFFVMRPRNEKLITFARAHNLFPLPKLTSERKRIFVSQAVNPDLFDIDGYITLILQISELCTVNDFNDGMEYIIDYGLFTKNVLLKLSQAKLKKLYIFLEEVYAKKILPIHGINLSKEALEFVRLGKKNLIKPGETLFTHAVRGYEVLHAYYSKDVLPKDYGGNLKTLAEYREEWINYLLENNDYLEKIQNVEVRENARIKRMKHEASTLFMQIVEE